jgi:hypothetical protein
MQTTQEIVTALQTQREATTAKVTELDNMVAEYIAAKKAERAELLAGVAPIDRALAALGVKVTGVTVSTGTRKPMSQEAKDRIREGLRKAAERKRQAATTPVLQQPLLHPVAAASTPAPKQAPAKTTGKKAGVRG